LRHESAVNEFPGYAKYGDELIGENATNVYDEADSGNPDRPRLDGRARLGFRGDTVARLLGPDGQEHVELPVEVGLTPTPSWWGGSPTARAMRLARLARIR
jgi:hypothetical protein